MNKKSNQELNTCVECDSPYFKNTSKMAALCPDCSHKLYGYPPCKHQFEDGFCKYCGWNGITSTYLKNLYK